MSGAQEFFTATTLKLERAKQPRRRRRDHAWGKFTHHRCWEFLITNIFIFLKPSSIGTSSSIRCIWIQIPRKTSSHSTQRSLDEYSNKLAKLRRCDALAILVMIIVTAMRMIDNGHLNIWFEISLTGGRGQTKEQVVLSLTFLKDFSTFKLAPCWVWKNVHRRTRTGG